MSKPFDGTWSKDEGAPEKHPSVKLAAALLLEHLVGVAKVLNLTQGRARDAVVLMLEDLGARVE